MAGQSGGANKSANRGGPRVSVLFGQVEVKNSTGQKTKKNTYCYMRKSTAAKLGLKGVAAYSQPKSQAGGKKRTGTALRGSFRAKSVKIPYKENNKNKMLTVPVPSSATIPTIRAFLSKCKIGGNKVETFYSPGGRSFSVIADGGK
jgi:hypothetical protein